MVESTEAIPRRVVIRTDADAVIGGGHVMRCLTLADALAERGSEILFVAVAMPESLQARIEAAGHRLARIAESAGMRREGADWEASALDPAAQAADAAATHSAAGERADWLIVDHYLLDAGWEEAMRAVARRILVIDDLANRRHDCDLLLDQTLGRTANDYRALVPGQARVLAGAHYALLRPEFSRERPSALRRRQESRPPSRLLISLGAMDLGGVTVTALEACLAAAPESHIDVVLAQSAPSAASVQKLAAGNPRVGVHHDIADMARLMRDADLAIGAGGTSSWERCCLGLPTVLLMLAANQRPSAEALASAGAAIAIESIDRLAPALAEFLVDPARLQAMSAAAFAIADGSGTERVVDAMLDQGEQKEIGSVTLRQATIADSERLWLWRNDPVTRAASRNAAPIAWTLHSSWLSGVLADAQRRLLIAETAGAPIGMVRFDALPGRASEHELSINVRPDARGAGVGAAILSAACGYFGTQLGPGRIRASVRLSNDTSRKLFERAGFIRAATKADDDFLSYVLDVAAPPRVAGRDS